MDDKEQSYEIVRGWEQDHMSVLTDLVPLVQNVLDSGGLSGGGLPAAVAVLHSATQWLWHLRVHTHGHRLLETIANAGMAAMAL